jgi:YegS/Rv2252/BmrU family lipid kinase
MVIVNPVAGIGRGAKCGRMIAAVEEKLDIFFTSPVKTAFDLAQEATRGNYKRVIGVGGDGTLCGIANGLLGSDIPLGIIPAGVGNDFSKGVGIPQNAREALDVALHGQLLPIDLGRIDNKIFVNVVSFGFDARLVRHIPTLRKKYFFLPGEGLYLIALSRELLSRLDCPKIWMRLHEDRSPRIFGQHTTALVVSNGPQYGGMFKIAPDASLVDGLLDICWIEAMDKRKILINLPKVLQGIHTRIPEVSMFRIPSLSIHSATKLACQVDGEVFESKHEYHISVIPKALNVVVPQTLAPQLVKLERAKVKAPGLQFA